MEKDTTPWHSTADDHIKWTYWARCPFTGDIIGHKSLQGVHRHMGFIPRGRWERYPEAAKIYLYSNDAGQVTSLQ